MAAARWDFPPPGGPNRMRLAPLVGEAQLVARGAAHARLWAICAAGIASIIVVGLVLYAAMPLIARMI